jgi:hypothetical protein
LGNSFQELFVDFGEDMGEDYAGEKRRKGTSLSE